MFEQSKAAKRRFSDGAFHTRYFVGEGIDIGAGQDSLYQHRKAFRGIFDVKSWDIPQGDAQKLAGEPDNHYDFLHASHSLEHMVDYVEALTNWVRVVKPGGFLIITIPSEQLYERNQWPSVFSGEHHWSFTLWPDSKLPKSVNVLSMLNGDLRRLWAVERIMEVYDFFDLDIFRDQTLLPNTECAIEIVLQKTGLVPSAQSPG